MTPMRQNIRLFFIFVMICRSTLAMAQQLQQQGTGVNDLIPAGWDHTEAQGDLNKDGFNDLVVVATPNFKEKTKTRDDGYVYNFNQPILAIYFGSAEGLLQLWQTYDQVIPAREDEYFSIDASLMITEKGVLRISLETFSSWGSWSSDDYNFSYRYQNGDFYLIGKETHSLSRNTGDVEIVSENYLTWKRQVVKENVMEDGKDTPKVEKWSRLSKKPLEKLGEPLL